MLNKKPLHIVFILLLYLCAHNAFALSFQTSQAGKKKLAVLKITFEDFSEQDKDTVNTTFYQYLSRDKRLTVMTETQVRNNLIPLGIDPSEIDDEAGYIRAGQVLNVDYVLVGNMDKIGNFVEVTFRVFTMPRGMQKKYPGGKTLDLLIKEEIPNIIKLIHQDLVPGETKEPGKKSAWRWIAIGGAAGGVASAIFFLSGRKEKNEIEPLPRPPTVPWI